MVELNAEELRRRAGLVVEQLGRLLSVAGAVAGVIAWVALSCLVLAGPAVVIALTSGAPWWLVAVVVVAALTPGVILLVAWRAVRAVDRGRAPALAELDQVLHHTGSAIEPLWAEIQRASSATGRIRRLLACRRLPSRLTDAAGSTAPNVVVVADGLARAVSLVPLGFSTAGTALPGATVASIVMWIAY